VGRYIVVDLGDLFYSKVCYKSMAFVHVNSFTIAYSSGFETQLAIL